MFEKQNHIHAIATVIGTLGGFQAAPKWFSNASKTALWQVLMGAILVFQGGGNLDFVYSLVVSVLFYMFIQLSSYIEVGPVNIKSAKSVTEEDAETYLNYY